MDAKEAFKDLLNGMELDLRGSAEDVAAYAAERAAYLSTLVGQVGFDGAVIAERDNVALRAGIRASEAAKATEIQALGVLQGALAIAAKALVV